MLLPNLPGGYSFHGSLGPYSAGVVAASGFTIQHIRLRTSMPWRAGFEAIDAHLAATGRPRAALCAIGLRSPRPFSFDGFREFNAGYVGVLKSWELMVDGANPIARTNVAPGADAPAEPSLYSFAYTVPIGTEQSAPSFVIAGTGELPEGSLKPSEVVRQGETSPAALADKARFVLGLMESRMQGLGVTWKEVTVTNIYTVHDLNVLLATEILPRIGPAGQQGVTWYYSRPPIESIEFEMDVRGCSREMVL